MPSGSCIYIKRKIKTREEGRKKKQMLVALSQSLLDFIRHNFLILVVAIISAFIAYQIWRHVLAIFGWGKTTDPAAAASGDTRKTARSGAADDFLPRRGTRRTTANPTGSRRETDRRMDMREYRQ